MANQVTNREALDPRVYLAVERTLLAWIRTGLAMMGFGFVVARFGLLLGSMTPGQDAGSNKQGGTSLWFGTSLILLGVAIHVLAGWQHTRSVDRLLRGEVLRPMRLSAGVILSGLLALLGIAMAVHLIRLG